jgi:hypothetical protein
MATGNIPGTNIPKSAVANNVKGDWKYWEARLKGAENPNDVLFELAYNTHFEGSKKKGADYQGQGDENPNVGNVQAGRWKLVGDTDTKDHKAGTSWAEEHINSSNDVYIQDGGDVVSMDPKTGKVLVNQKDSDGNLGNAPVGAVISGDQSKLDSDILTWIKGTTSDNSGDGATTTAASSLLNYRPWTQRYWNQNIPEKSQGLLEMSQNLQPEYSLSYLPGEFRDPNTWATWEGEVDAAGNKKTGHLGHVPEGAWRRATVADAGYLPDPALPGTPRSNLWSKKDYGGDKGVEYQYIKAPGWNVNATDPRLITAANPTGLRQASTPWDFTAPAMGTNIAWQPWNAKSMNLESANVADWGKFLKSIDTSPAVDTSGLLGTV